MKKVNLKSGLSLSLILVFGLSLALSSCKKDKTAGTNTSASADESFAENIYNNVSNIADEAYSLKTNNLKSADGSGRLFLGDCVTISLDTTAIPRILTIDFGTENCLCADGKYRRGKILVSFTGRYRHPATVITHGFDEYYVNDNKVDGIKIVTNMGFNDNNKMWFKVEVNGVIYLANNAGTISWASSIERVWEEGRLTAGMWDDVYLLSGTSNGIRANGNTWEREVINPLRKELSCRHIVSGTMEIRPQGLPVRLLDFGNGECDNIATVIVNGETYTITLP